MVKVQVHLRAVMWMGQKARKYWCRLPDSNWRPSVYKTHGSVPATAEISGFASRISRSCQIISGSNRVQRCMVHPRAVVASIHIENGPAQRIQRCRGLIKANGGSP